MVIQTEVRPSTMQHKGGRRGGSGFEFEKAKDINHENHKYVKLSKILSCYYLPKVE